MSMIDKMGRMNGMELDKLEGAGSNNAASQMKNIAEILRSCNSMSDVKKFADMIQATDPGLAAQLNQLVTAAERAGITDPQKLADAVERSGSVGENIEKFIEKLQEMSNDGAAAQVQAINPVQEAQAMFSENTSSINSTSSIGSIA